MEMQPRFEALLRVLGIVGVIFCLLGAVLGMIVVLVRLASVAHTKLEMLFGVLQGTAVSLLFAIAALLICLTLMVRRATHQPTPMSWSGRSQT